MNEDSLRTLGAVAIFRKPVDVHAFMRCVNEWAGKEVPELQPV
jgi:hypothetical protein